MIPQENSGTDLGAAAGAGFARPAEDGGMGRCCERAESWRLSLAKPVSTPAAAVILSLQAEITRVAAKTCSAFDIQTLSLQR